MRYILIVTALCIAALITPSEIQAQGRYAGDFPTTGKGFFYLCWGAKLTNINYKSDTVTEYLFKGTCTIVVKNTLLGIPMVINDVPVIAKGSYNSVIAKESVKLAGGSTINSITRCENDPFRNGTSECIDDSPNNQVSVSSDEFLFPFFELMIPREYPIMADNASEQAIASASSALEVADTEEVDLSDWDPFAESAGEPPSIEIHAPVPYAVLPADTAYDVAIVKKTRAGPPAHVQILFEQLVESPQKVGDVALPQDKTHWWVPRWSSSVAWSSLPFKVVPVRARKVLTNEGIYRVRVRATQASGGFLGGWTTWRGFCVGEQEACTNAEKLAQVGDQTQKLVLESLKRSSTKKP